MNANSVLSRWSRAVCAGAGLFAAHLLGAEESKPAEPERTTVIVVAGAAGEAEFATGFTEQLATWRKVAGQANARLIAIGEDAGETPTDHDRLKDAVAAETKAGSSELWIVLVGHGTFDGKEAKFNLRGPDVSTAELAEWLKPFKRPLALVDTASSSAPFMAKLAGPGRVVITATRSGYEQNFARFGKYFAEAIADPQSDLDKDGQVSLLESFLSAAHRTNDFYKTEGRLATEHALVDDNGDGLGTPAEWFRGTRAVKQARDNSPLDGARAQQFVLLRSAAEQQLSPQLRAQRDKLELRIAELREMKPKMKDEAYYKELERLLLELAAIYEGT